MNMRRYFSFLILLLAPLAVMAAGGKNQGLSEVAADAQARATQFLKDCASSLGVGVEGNAVISIAEDTTSAVMPAEGVSELTRADFNDKWVTLGVISVTAPVSPNGEPVQPGGTYTVRAKATAGSSQGCFQIVDVDGKIVQEGDMTIEVAPEDKASAGDAYYCYYPYWRWFRIYPRYWWGYWHWHWRWRWGYLRIYWWWWHPYWNCCGPWYWWWYWRC